MLNPSAPEDWQLSTFADLPTSNGHIVVGQKYVTRPLTEALVVSDPDAWALQPSTSSALNCRNRLVAGRRATIDATSQHPCKTWGCRRCAEQKVIPDLVRGYRAMRDRATVTVLTAPRADLPRDTFRRMVGRGVDLDSLADPEPLPRGSTWGLYVERSDGTAYAYTSARVTGSLGAFAEVMDSIDAFEHFRTVAMSLPGLDRVPSWCGQLAPPKSLVAPTGSDFTRQGVTDAPRSNFVAERDRVSERDHGQSYASLLADGREIEADLVVREAINNLASRPRANRS